MPNEENDSSEVSNNPHKKSQSPQQSSDSDESIEEGREGEREGGREGRGESPEIGRRLKEVSSHTKEMVDEVKKTRVEISGLKDEIQKLESMLTGRERDNEMEPDQETEKRRETRELQEKFEEAIEEYRQNVEWIKRRLLESLPSKRAVDEINYEFERTESYRSEAVKTDETRLSTNYEVRADRLDEARNNFVNATEEFMSEREEVTSSLDELRTEITGIGSETKVNVPFWVVGIKKNGTEEIRVLPVQEISGEETTDTEDEIGTQENNGKTKTKSKSKRTEETEEKVEDYTDYLRPHPVHGYESMVDDVKRNVVQNVTRNKLARRERTFTAPSCLPENMVSQRFVEEFEKYELERRKVEEKEGDGTDGDEEKESDFDTEGSDSENPEGDTTEENEDVEEVNRTETSSKETKTMEGDKK